MLTRSDRNKRHKRLVKAFEVSNMSLSEVARQAGCSPTYVANLLRGEIPEYKLVTLERVEAVLGLKAA